MTGVGKTQGYTGCECRKDKSEVGEDRGDGKEEVVEDIRCIFFGVNQENPHELGDSLSGIDVFHRRNRKWRGG